MSWPLLLFLFEDNSYDECLALITVEGYGHRAYPVNAAVWLEGSGKALWEALPFIPSDPMLVCCKLGDYS